jgi:hypothetical protein
MPSILENPLNPIRKNKGRIRRVCEVNWSTTHPIRGGFIIYTIDSRGKIYVGLGVDNRSGELTDFGGGIKYRRDPTALHGAIRELMEETLSIFGPVDISNPAIQQSPVILTSNMIIIFVRVQLDGNGSRESRETISRRFRDRVRYLKCPEVRDIIWLNIKKFKSLIESSSLSSSFPSSSSIGIERYRIYSRVSEIILSSNILNYF